MTTVITVNSNYHFLIPQIFRKNLNIKAGQKWQIVQIDDRLELIPVKKLQEMRGFFIPQHIFIYWLFLLRFLETVLYF